MKRKEEPQIVIQATYKDYVKATHDVEPGEIRLGQHDEVKINVGIDVMGWLFKYPEAVEEIRQELHNRVDRQVDRMVFDD